MRLYVYCLCEEFPAAKLEAIVGLGGARPHLIHFQGITAVVSDFDADCASLSRENVFGHELVVSHVLSHTTPLPFRFGTITTILQLENYVRSRHSALRAMLENVRGSVEMSVKITWDIDAVKRDIAEIISETTATSRRVAGQGSGPGTAFLVARQHEILGDEALRRRSEEVKAWLNEYLGDVAKQTVTRLQPRESLVLAAAYLVERARLDEYEGRLAAARAERPVLHFLTSGPWPPYSFSQLSS